MLIIKYIQKLFYFILSQFKLGKEFLLLKLLFFNKHKLIQVYYCLFFMKIINIYLLILYIALKNLYLITYEFDIFNYFTRIIIFI